MIFLTAGHHRKDPGAVYNGRKEAVETIRLRNAVTEVLRSKNIPVWNDNDDWDLNTVIAEISKQSKATDIICDLHFNAGGPSATGTEVLIPTDSSSVEKKLAKSLVDLIASTLIIKNRGVKTEADSQHKRLGMMRPRGENVLCEICFISNTYDMSNYDTYFGELVPGIAGILASFSA